MGGFIIARGTVGVWDGVEGQVGGCVSLVLASVIVQALSVSGTTVTASRLRPFLPVLDEHRLCRFVEACLLLHKRLPVQGWQSPEA